MWLRIVTGEDAGQEVVLGSEPLVLGRQAGCDVVIRDPHASRRHAELRLLAGGQVLLRDLDSANGTRVDGEPVAEAVLSGGEELALAGVRIAVFAEPVLDPGREPAAATALAVSATAAATAVAVLPEAPPLRVPPPPPAPPTPSSVRRLVDRHVTRVLRATGGVALLAGVVAAVALLLVLGDDDGVTASAASAERIPGVIARVTPSTVLVESLRGGRRTGTGSGWVLDAAAGLVVTNVHVLNQGDTVEVAAGGRRRSAQVVAAAQCEDVALLRVADRAGLRSARLATAGTVRQGEWVVALGFGGDAAPGDEPTATSGVVSSTQTDLRDGGPDVPDLLGALRTDTALNPGNSGGPLVDLDGAVVGMNAAVVSTGADGRPRQNENYAIAADRLRTVLAGLRGGRSTGWTGLTYAYPTPSQLAARRLPDGLLVTGAHPGSPGERAGLARASGVLVEVDGRPVGSTLRSYCAAAGDGAPASLTFARAGSGRLSRVALPARRAG
jgi:putative serine protease PepD